MSDQSIAVGAPTQTRPLSPHERRRLAVEAGVHPITAAKYLGAGEIRSTCRDRIERALAALGRSDLIRSG